MNHRIGSTSRRVVAPEKDSRARRALALALIAPLALLALEACSLRRGPIRVDSRRIQGLQRQVVRETRCPTVTTTMLTAEVAQVHGCGWVREYSLITIGRARGRWRAIGPVWERAASEMQCPVQQLTVTAPSATLRAVSGCGRAAEYGLSCAAECIWTMRRWQATGGPPGSGSAAFAQVPPPPGAASAPAPSSAGDASAAEPTAGGDAPAAASAAPEAGASAAGEAGASAAGDATTSDAAVASTPSASAAVGTTTDPSAFVVPDPPRPGSPEASLRGFLDERRAAIRACTGAGRLEILARWNVAGDVTFALAPPLAGTAAEACVQRGLGGARFAGASSDGEVRHTIY